MYPFAIVKHTLIVFLLCWISTAGSAQSLMQKKVSIELKNKPLSEALTAISRQGGFYFSYNSNIISKDSLVTISVKNKTVKQVLDLLLGAHCQYRETDKYIIIQPAEREKWYTISGYIKDANSGDALPDVSVFERQQLASAITGKDGYFSLQLKDHKRYSTAEITVSKGFYIDTSVSLLKGYDQQLELVIAPETYSLPSVVVTQHSGVERSWLGRLFISSKLKTQTLNLGKFFVDKPYQFSLTPGLGTHGKMSGQVENKFSLNVLGGYTAGVDGFEVGGLFNINKKDVRYAQFAGVCNIVAGNVEGFQAGGISNYNGLKTTGFQAAGIINTTGSMEGFQAAGIVNITTDTAHGVQTAGIVNIAKRANIQAAGICNIAEDVEGVQLGGVANIADSIKGVQASGCVNIAENVNGAQVAGFMNIAHKVKGVQISGFINIADSCDYPIGLINIVKSGDAAIGASIDEYGHTVIALRSGGRVLYGILGAGGIFDATTFRYAFEAGLGAHWNLRKHFRINVELAALTTSDMKGNAFQDNALRILPAVRFGPLEIFGGAGCNIAVYNFTPQQRFGQGNTIWEYQGKYNNTSVRVGYKVGVQVHI